MTGSNEPICSNDPNNNLSILERVIRLNFAVEGDL